jgi:hypothetical protein
MIEAEWPCPTHGDAAARPLLAVEDVPEDLRTCSACQRAWEDVRRLRDLGRSLHWDAPDRARAARLRASVVAATSSPARPPLRMRRRIVTLAGGVMAGAACAVVAVLAFRYERTMPVTASMSGPAAPHAVPLGEVQPVGFAHYERLSAAPDEVVRLREGRIHVVVAHLGPRERFRVLTEDAVVEVRGTEFELEASAARLQSVQVERGRVEVTVQARETHVLVAGGRWTAPNGALPATRSSVAPVSAGPPGHPPDRHANPRPSDHPAPTPMTPGTLSTPPVVAPPSAEGSKATALERAAPPTTPATKPAPTQSPDLDSRRLESEERREERREQREDRRRERLERRR